MEQEKKNLVQVGDSFFKDAAIKELIEKNPYVSFIVLSALLEFLGKCNKLPRDFVTENESSRDCYDVINNLEALKEYRVLNYKVTHKKGKEIDKNYLYSGLRCGMLHAMLPAEDIILTPEENDTQNKKIGAKILYEDFCKAWSELKEKEDILQEMEKTTVLKIVESSTGSTVNERVEILK